MNAEGITRRQEQAAEAIKEAAALQWQVDRTLDRAIAAFDAAETHNESDQIATLLQNIYDANSEQAQRWLATVREQWLFPAEPERNSGSAAYLTRRIPRCKNRLRAVFTPTRWPNGALHRENHVRSDYRP